MAGRLESESGCDSQCEESAKRRERREQMCFTIYPSKDGQRKANIDILILLIACKKPSEAMLAKSDA